jgi:two-component system sensor kinase FixL
LLPGEVLIGGTQSLTSISNKIVPLWAGDWNAVFSAALDCAWLGAGEAVTSMSGFRFGTGRVRRGRDALDMAQRLVRPFAARHLLVLATVAVLVLVDQAIIQPQLVRLNYLAPAINVAGRQRMLSQKLSKEALALAQLDGGRSRADELCATVERWTAAHRALLSGNREENLQPVRSVPVIAALHELEPHFQAMRTAALTLAEYGRADRGVARPGELDASLRSILDHEPSYLRGMEGTVGLLESEARSQIAWLRGCGLLAAALVLLVLVGVYFAVIRAATQLVRRQVRRDLRRRAAAQARLRRLSAELAHASRVTALGQLAAGLAHEINQPLGAIVNYAGTCEVLLERSLPSEPRAREAVGEMKRAALRAGAIVRRMRSFVRPGVRHADGADLNDLVREVAELCRSELTRSDVELTLELTPAPTPVYVDALQIQQVLVNLFQNAIQAMLTSPRRQRVLRVGTRIDDGKVQLEVADSGPGFAACVQDVFTPFFTTKADGLGMGLSISRSIIEQHQGRIWADGGAGGGAVLRFSLPLCRATNFDGRPAYRICG